GGDEELLARGRGRRIRARYHGHDRLRRAVATGARDARRSGATNRGRAHGADAPGLPNGAVGLLRGVPPGLPGDPCGAAPARGNPLGTAPERTGRVQRVRRADPVAALPDRSGSSEDRAPGEVVHRAGGAAPLNAGLSPISLAIVRSLAGTL